MRDHDCFAVTDASVLCLDRKLLKAIKQRFQIERLSEEFKKFETVIRGNYLVKR